MNLIKALKGKIQQEKLKNGRAIVFWYDSSQQTTVETIESNLENDEVLVRELTQRNFFKLKYEIEIEHPNQSYVLYAHFAKPPEKENYLLDILLYSTEYKADEEAVLAELLSIKDDILRTIMERYPLFFRNQERKQKLNRVLPREADERHLELAMIAVLANVPSISIPDITRRILIEGLDATSNEAIHRIGKYFSLGRAWELIQQYFGVSVLQQEKPLHVLLETLLYQHFKRDSLVEIEELDEDYRSSLPNVCALFIDDWLRADEKDVIVLENYIKDMETIFALRHHLAEMSSETIEKVNTFPTIDYLLIEKVIDELQHKVSNLHKWRERIQYRSDTHWGKKENLNSLYCTLFEAVRLTEYKTLLKKYDSSAELYHQYSDQLFVIDNAYRRFMHAYTRLENRELVESLAISLTNWYENVYLLCLADETNRFLEENQSSRIKSQRSFFSTYIRPILDKESTKVFVIISDALRYEAGYELHQRLNQRANGQATISPLFGSLPSYTQLGMAALLPNSELTINKKVVYTGEHPTNGLENREKILKEGNQDAVAYHLEDLFDWSSREADENFKGKRLVYLYHDVIDATGDARKSERETYDAVEKTLLKLQRAVEILSRIQAKRIFITADHGFLFQYNKVEVDGKVPAVTGEVFERNRRFAVGHSLSVPEGAVRLNENQTFLKNVEVVLAKGMNRFISGGGLQFIHGGAMPQEVITPLIDYRRTERIEPVSVSVAMLDKNITTHRVSVSFYQEESVLNGYLPRQLKMAFYKNGEQISNEMTMTFDMTGDNQTRNRKVVFTLLEKYYAIGESCTLRIETMSDNKVDLYKEERFVIRMYDALY